jgi:hypothetical protein
MTSSASVITSVGVIKLTITTKPKSKPQHIQHEKLINAQLVRHDSMEGLTLLSISSTTVVNDTENFDELMQQILAKKNEMEKKLQTKKVEQPEENKQEQDELLQSILEQKRAKEQELSRKKSVVMIKKPKLAQQYISDPYPIYEAIEGERVAKIDPRTVISLFGAMDTGKSTFLRQLMEIYNVPLQESYINACKYVIFSNVLEALQFMADWTFERGTDLPLDLKVSRIRSIIYDIELIGTYFTSTISSWTST